MGIIMKKPGYSFLLFLLLSFSVISSTQEKTFSLDGTLFAPAPDGMELLEIWQEPHWDETLGIARNMVVTNEGHIILWNDKGYTARIDQNGKILGLSRGINSTVSIIMDNILYGTYSSFKNNRHVTSIRRFDSNTRFIDEMKLRGGPQYPGSLIGISSDGSYIFIKTVFDEYYDYIYKTTIFNRFDRNGRFVASWNVRKSIPDLSSYIGDFKLLIDDSMAVYYGATKEIIRFDLEGNIISRFKPEKTSPYTYTDRLYVLPGGDLMLFDSYNKYAQVFTPDGILIRQFRLRGQEYSSRTFTLCFDKSGNIYSNNSDRGTIAKFGPQGRYIKDIAPNDQLVVPAKMLRNIKHKYEGEYIDLGPDGNLIFWIETASR